jgi:hypothetical protein
MPKHENVTVRLIGEDGNAFNLIGATARELAKFDIDPEEFTDAAFACKSYDELLNLISDTVHVS